MILRTVLVCNIRSHVVSVAGLDLIPISDSLPTHHQRQSALHKLHLRCGLLFRLARFHKRASRFARKVLIHQSREA